MNHYVLFTKLIERNLPFKLLHILETWFTMSETCMRLGGQYSSFYKLTAGVRQGGVLSPLLFAIFIDGIVNKIKCLVLCVYSMRQYIYTWTTSY